MDISTYRVGKREGRKETGREEKGKRKKERQWKRCWENNFKCIVYKIWTKNKISDKNLKCIALIKIIIRFYKNNSLAISISIFSHSILLLLA